VAISYKIEIASASPRNDQLESLNLGRNISLLEDPETR
jgi:hypothetical protein